MQVSGPLKEDTVTVPKIAAVERREGAAARGSAGGRLRNRCPIQDLRRSGAPPPSGRQRKRPGESPEPGQDELTSARLSPCGARGARLDDEKRRDAMFERDASRINGPPNRHFKAIEGLLSMGPVQACGLSAHDRNKAG